MVYAPHIKKSTGSGKPKAPKPRQPNSPMRTVRGGEHPKKPAEGPRGGTSLYTRKDPNTGMWVMRTFAELNGTLPPKNPKRIKRGHDGTVVIEVGQRWMEQTTKFVVIVKGVYPSAGTLVWAPNREPDCNQRPVWQRDFTAKFTPYDLVPD